MTTDPFPGEGKMQQHEVPNERISSEVLLKRRRQLEDQIKAAIQSFSNDTGLVVNWINPEYVDAKRRGAILPAERRILIRVLAGVVLDE